MPLSSLPTEILEEIFSLLSSSTSDLFSLRLVSRAVYKLVKPGLYRQITITGSQQRCLLSQVREADKQLVKKVVILGDGPVVVKSGTLVQDPPGRLGEAIVMDLLTGNLLDIRYIQTLHIRKVHEYTETRPFPLKRDFQAASNLTELSVWNHRGGGSIWLEYLRDKKNVPKLKRFGFVDVTHYGGEHETIQRTPLIAPYDQFDLAIATPPRIFFDIEHFDFGKRFLANITPFNQLTNHLLSEAKSFRISPPVSTAGQPQFLQPIASFYNLLTGVTKGRNPPVFVSISSQVMQILEHETFEGDRFLLEVEHLRSKGHKISIEEDEESEFATSLILPSFVKFVQGQDVDGKFSKRV